jgi:hypothetical protein
MIMAEQAELRGTHTTHQFATDFVERFPISDEARFEELPVFVRPD